MRKTIEVKKDIDNSAKDVKVILELLLDIRNTLCSMHIGQNGSAQK